MKDNFNLKSIIPNCTLYFSVLFLFAICVFTSGQVQCQTNSSSFISYNYREVVEYSVKFTYSSSGSYSYHTPYSTQNALATLQARYDYYHGIISAEYYKLKDLKLINEANQLTLQGYKNQRLNEIYEAGSNWDLGNSTNSMNLINYCCEIYSYTAIKSELTLLKSCKQELDRIKYKDPDNYIYSSRYKSVMRTLELLRTCSPSEIKNLSWEKTEIENSSKNKYVRAGTSSFYYYRNSESIQIDNVTKSDNYTILHFTCFPSKEYSSGWWVNYNTDAYIEQIGVKYYLKKAEGMPLSPNKHYFSNENEKLSFKLYFSKSVDLNKKFDLIEIEGSNTAFNFFSISK